MTLFQVVVRVKACCDELGVVYQTVLVCVDHLHSSGQVVELEIDSGDVFEPFLQLLDRQLTVAVYVNFREGVSEILDLVFRDAGGDQL